METNNKTQQGFANYFKKPSDTTHQAEEVSQTEKRHQAKSKEKESFSKHNLTFSDVLFTKLKYIQLSTGKTQRELLDGAIRKFVEEYESKNGIIKVKSIEL